MARAADSASGADPKAVMPSGRTLAEEIRARTGQIARARSSAMRFSRRTAGTVPIGPENIIPVDVIDVLKHGDFNDDQQYLDQRVSTATGVDPFTRIGHVTDKKMRDFITLYDISDYYYEGQMVYQHKDHTGTAGPRVQPAAQKDDPNYVYTSPAPLSEVPTATSNPSKPRTVGAGFLIDEKATHGKLTIVFRDGTYYNYYDVPLKEWEEFKSLPSKGAYIRSTLDKHSRGPASDVNLDQGIREELYRILRSVQGVAKGRPMDKRQRSAQTKGASPKYANPTPRNSYRLNRARTK